MTGADKPEFPPLLPAGFHDLDASGRHRLCVQRFAESVTRPRIMRNLENTIDQINQQSIRGYIWINGSFLTEKLNPDDADIALLVSRGMYSTLNSAQQSFFDHFSRASLYAQFRIDNYAIVLDPSLPEDQWWYAYWLRQFGFSRRDELKGIIRVSVPFLVAP